MAQTVRRSRQSNDMGTGMRLPEIIFFVVVVALIVGGVRYYFVTYRHSPGFALGEFLGAVKAGDSAKQYALLDAQDKEAVSSVKDYEKAAQWAQGFTERIDNVSLAAPTIPDPKKPDVVDIEAHVSIRKQGQKVYESGSDSFVDHYKMRKGADGDWKVWLSESDAKSLNTATPTPAGSPL